jgi:hypothetical protein
MSEEFLAIIAMVYFYWSLRAHRAEKKLKEQSQ